jgi:glycosyltransferase involved in cell wall biosynthesis
MVVYSYYPRDQRVRREAETLTENGASVHVICLRKNGEADREIHNDIAIYRVPQAHRRTVGYAPYFFRYLMFVILSTLTLTRLFIRFRYDVIHVHSIPDYLVFCAAVPKMLGARVILDLHELMPEIFATKFDASMDSGKVKVALLLERASVGFAHCVITTSPTRRKKLQTRTKRGDMTVLMNLPKLDVYEHRDLSDFMKQEGLEESFIILYVGGLYRERELDVVIRAVKSVEIRIPEIVFVLCGSGEEDYITSLRELTRELGLEKKVRYLGYVPQSDVLNFVEMSDVALCPYKYYPKLAEVLDGVSSTKVFEYLLVPRPVIVSDIPAWRREFQDMVLFYESGKPEGLGHAIYQMYENREVFDDMAQRAREALFERYDPEANEQKIIKVYSHLLGRD